MKVRVVMEKVRDNRGRLRDVKFLSASQASTIFAAKNPGEYKWVQVIDGRVVQAFKDDELEVLDLETYAGVDPFLLPLKTAFQEDGQ